MAVVDLCCSQQVAQVMSGRGQSRGGSAPRGGRGGARGGGPGGGPEKKRKEHILNLATYVEKSVRIKFLGSRQVTGTLKGFDQLMNLVLDDVTEEFEDGRPSRSLGLVVLRGPNISLISPTDGSAEIANPFAAE